MISNIQAVNITESNNFILGIPGHYIENGSLNNLSFSFKDKDDRSVIKINDVINGEISGLTAESTETSAPFVWLNNSEEIKIQNTSLLSRTNGDVNLLGNLRCRMAQI